MSEKQEPAQDETANGQRVEESPPVHGNIPPPGPLPKVGPQPLVEEFVSKPERFERGLRQVSQELAEAELRRWKRSKLAALCESRNLSPKGNKAELIQRILGARRTAAGGYVGGKRACKFCKAPVRVNGSRMMKGGTRMLSLKCDGRRRHSYTVYE